MDLTEWLSSQPPESYVAACMAECMDSPMGDPREPVSWVPTTPNEIAWVASKIRAAQDTIEQIAQEYTDLRAQIDRAEKTALARHERQLEWAVNHVGTWLDNGGKQDIPGYKISVRAGTDALVIWEDEETVVAWLEQHAPEAIKKSVIRSAAKRLVVKKVTDTTEKLRPAINHTIAKAYTNDGEEIPGVRMVRTSSFSILERGK